MYGLKPVPFKKVLTQGLKPFKAWLIHVRAEARTLQKSSHAGAKALPAFAAGMYGLKPAPFAQGSFLQPLPQQPF
jgi:hypothetical protein